MEDIRKVKMKDSFGREITYLRISVTELCNLRCRYCMPEDGVCKLSHADMMTEEEMLTAIEAAVDLGITKIRITGGEPLVKKNIVSICEHAANLPGVKEVCLTTNGVLLPKLAKPLKDAGVTRFNISLDTLKPEKFNYITRIGNLKDALDGIQAAIDEGFEKTKLNAVLIGGFNDDEIEDLASLTVKMPVDMRFIEMMPMYDSGDFGPESFISADTVIEKLQDKGLEAVPADGGVAKLYRLPASQGNIGLIRPVSAHFCGTCNRLRLTSDGKIKPCLHSSDEYCLKGLDKAGMTEVLKEAIMGKPQWHGELSYDNRSQANRNMNQIGG